MQDILEFWFPNNEFNKFWFDKSKDEFIIQNFKDILIQLENTELNFNQSDKVILENIILLDQFSRSIYRNNPTKVKENDNKALALTEYFFENRDWKNIKFNHIIFYLMPYRHTFKKEYYHKTFEILNFFKKENNSKLFEKFYNVTNKKYTLFNTITKCNSF